MKNIDSKVNELRERMIRNAMYYNKCLTRDYLQKLNSEQLLSFTHYEYRKDFSEELVKLFKERFAV